MMFPGWGVETASETKTSSRRDGVRIEREIDCVIESQGGTYLAQAVDLSRTGALLTIRDPKFLKTIKKENASSVDGRIRKALRWGIVLRFGPLRCRAIVVRVVVSGNAVQLGCTFCMRLPHVMCNTLGIPDADDVPQNDE